MLSCNDDSLTSLKCFNGNDGNFAMTTCPTTASDFVCYHLYPTGNKNGIPSSKGCIQQSMIPQTTGGVFVAPGECKEVTVDGSPRTECICNTDGWDKDFLCWNLIKFIFSCNDGLTSTSAGNIKCFTGENGAYTLQACDSNEHLCFHLHPPGDKTGNPSYKGCMLPAEIIQNTGGVSVAPGECKEVTVDGVASTKCACKGDG